MSDARTPIESHIAKMTKFMEFVVGKSTDFCVELRCLNVTEGGRTQTKSSFYSPLNMANLCRDAFAVSRRATGCYFTINPLTVDLLSRRNGKLQFAKRDGLEKCENVIRRSMMYVDIDTITSISDISASDEEKEKAKPTVQAVSEFLKSEGFPDPIQIDSGNGKQLWFKIDLPNDKASKLLISKFLKALSDKFTCEFAKIDKSVIDASRITKIPGTYARKGENTPERPHRMAKPEVEPDTFECVPTELIQKIAAFAKDDVKNAPSTPSRIPLQSTIEVNARPAGRSVYRQVAGHDHR